MRGYWVVVVALVAACWKPASTHKSKPPPSPSKSPPAAAVDHGDFLAAWSDDRNTSPQGRHQVYAARMRDDGSLIDVKGIAVDTRPHRARPVVIAESTKRGWWIASELSDFSTPAAKQFTVWARRLDGSGALGPPIQMSDVARDRGDFDLATAGDDAIVAWAGMRRTTTQAALVIGDKKIPVAVPQNTGRRPSVTFEPVHDRYVLAYREPTAIVCVLVDRGGVVHDTFSIPGTSPRVDDGAQVAAIGTGEVLVTWVEADERTLTAARLDIASGQITERATLRTSATTMLRHTLVRGQRGYVLGWHEQSPRGSTFAAAWLAGDPFSAPPLPIDIELTRPEEMPQVQAGPRGFLVTWLRDGEPYAVRVADDGAVRDAEPRSLRGVVAEPVAASALQASLDLVAKTGADYCPQVGHDRAVPPTVRGLYVVEGVQPWGTLYIPGFGWGGSTGSSPRRSLYVGRGPEFVPHFRARTDTPHPFELTVEIPDAKRKRIERIATDPDDAKSATAAGVAGPLDLVDLEVNGGLGGKGLHFVITKATVVEDATKLRPRFVAARAAFDKRVAASKQELERVLGDAKRAALAANPYPVKGQLPREESVVYLPTYRPGTGRIEILFGYRLTAAVMMKFPPPQPSTHPHKHADGPPPKNPRPLRWSVMMGARYTLDGDKLVAEEIWAPSIPGTNNIDVPWQCTPPQGTAPAVATPACSGAPPAANYVCVRDCGNPAPSDSDPPPGWSWLSPDQAARRQQFGCPICLPGSARVATPDGDIPITSLAVGATVLTVDDTGRRVPATVLHVGSTVAGSSHRVVRVELADGRVVHGSPGHPRAGGGTLGDLRAGDVLDGGRVVRVTREPLDGDRTWDILPSGPTGLYVIDGVVLRSSFEMH